MAAAIFSTGESKGWENLKGIGAGVISWSSGRSRVVERVIEIGTR
jgi:hypothetical protein